VKRRRLASFLDMQAEIEAAPDTKAGSSVEPSRVTVKIQEVPKVLVLARNGQAVRVIRGPQGLSPKMGGRS
jgi:hypothetical protein